MDPTNKIPPCECAALLKRVCFPEELCSWGRIPFFALDTYRTQPITQIVGKKTFSSGPLLLNVIGIVSLPSVGPGSGPNLLKK